MRFRRRKPVADVAAFIPRAVELSIKGDIEVLRLQPGDAIIVSFKRHPPYDALERILGEVRKRFPGHEVIFTDGVTLTVQREELTA